MSQKKPIAVSACLLGHRVRYDGEHQANEIIITTLTNTFQIIPVCPEMEIGLGVPRKKIELHQQQGGEIVLLTTTEPVIDLTDRMVTYAHSFLNNHKIAGFILKDKSPSCGVSNCKQWSEREGIQRTGTGIFAAMIMQLQPDLPMLQSNELVEQSKLVSFIQKVNNYEY